MGLMGLMGGMGIRDGKRGDRIFNRLGKMFFRTGEEKGPGNRRKKERGREENKRETGYMIWQIPKFF